MQNKDKKRDYMGEDSLYMEVAENVPSSPAFGSSLREDQELLNSNLSMSERARRKEIMEEVRKDQEQEKELENEVRRRKIMGVKKPSPSGSLRSASIVPPTTKKYQKPKDTEKPKNSKVAKKRSSFNPALILTGVLVIVLLCLIVLCKKAIDSVIDALENNE